MVREAVSPNGKSFPYVVWSWAAPKGYDAPQASAEAIRNAALEDAASACDRQERMRDRKDAQAVCRLCARDVRALKSTAAKDGGEPDYPPEIWREDSARGAGDVAWIQRFVSDAHTAAGLVSHGKQSKALGARLGEGCMRALAVLADRQQRASDANDRQAWHAGMLAAGAEPPGEDRKGKRLNSST